MEENKQRICDLLLATLQETRGAHDLVSLNYDAEKEVVIGTFTGGGKKVCNVAADSGCAMIRDIMKQLGV
ncbi:MAG: hypothetical protein E7251_01380 [Paenibacillaceae bacterium]|nr:hypothetical protein [Paenibacillaceae bacterium]